MAGLGIPDSGVPRYERVSRLWCWVLRALGRCKMSYFECPHLQSTRLIVLGGWHAGLFMVPTMVLFFWQDDLVITSHECIQVPHGECMDLMLCVDSDN